MKTLGYHFQDAHLLKRALTHTSFDPKASYERLEFLGDGLLDVIIRLALMQHFDVDEGRLSRMRASLVRQETLHTLALELGLPSHICLGAGERKANGAHKPSILADVVEALIGAIYLDCREFSQVQEVVLAWYGERIQSANTQSQKDAKTRLQEHLQARQMALPIYELLKREGTPPKEQFLVCCRVKDVAYAPKETGTSKKQAQHKCALRMLNHLQQI